MTSPWAALLTAGGAVTAALLALCSPADGSGASAWTPRRTTSSCVLAPSESPAYQGLLRDGRLLRDSMNRHALMVNLLEHALRRDDTAAPRPR